MTTWWGGDRRLRRDGREAPPAGQSGFLATLPGFRGSIAAPVAAARSERLTRFTRVAHARLITAAQTAGRFAGVRCRDCS